MKKAMYVAMAGAMSMMLAAGCGTSDAKSTASADNVRGSILLSVNPEIELSYDEKGTVLELEGINDDGDDVVSESSDIQGDSCKSAINKLIKKLYEDGYFEETVAGHDKNIVLKLEKGSEYPDDDFLEEIVEGVKATVEECGGTSLPIAIDDDDYDEQGYIGIEKAKEIVLTQLGMKEADFVEKSYELDDGVYELEFENNNVEYEYEVDAVSGKVLEADFEHNDDWDDDDAEDDVADADDDDDADWDDDDDDDRDDVNDKDDDDDDDRDDVNDRDDDDDDDDDDDKVVTKKPATKKTAAKPAVTAQDDDDDDQDDADDNDDDSDDDDDDN